MITILNPNSEIDCPAEIRPSSWLRLSFYDVNQLDTVGYKSPEKQDIEALIDHGKDWALHSNMVVHCAAGQSRSSAAIIILLAYLNPGRESEIVDHVRNKARHILPNRPMIQLGDQVLKSNGKLIEGLDFMKPPSVRAFSHPIPFPVDLTDLGDDS